MALAARTVGLNQSTPRTRTMPKKLPRDELKDIWKRTKLSGTEVAKRAGYAAPSGFYALMQDKQGSRPISHEAIKRLIPVLRGLGEPPVTIDELLAISDAAPVGQAATASMSAIVTAGADRLAMARETGGALLPIRFRCERGTYIDSKAPPRSYGVSRIAISTEYPMASQSSAVVSDLHAVQWFKSGTHLHVVQPTMFSDAEMNGRTVILGTSTRGDLVEVVVARVHRMTEAGEVTYSLSNGDQVSGVVMGVVIGAYVQL